MRGNSGPTWSATFDETLDSGWRPHRNCCRIGGGTSRFHAVPRKNRCGSETGNNTSWHADYVIQASFEACVTCQFERANTAYLETVLFEPEDTYEGGSVNCPVITITPTIRERLERPGLKKGRNSKGLLAPGKAPRWRHVKMDKQGPERSLKCEMSLWLRTGHTAAASNHLGTYQETQGMQRWRDDFLRLCNKRGNPTRRRMSASNLSLTFAWQSVCGSVLRVASSPYCLQLLRYLDSVATPPPGTRDGRRRPPRTDSPIKDDGSKDRRLNHDFHFRRRQAECATGQNTKSTEG